MVRIHRRTVQKGLHDPEGLMDWLNVLNVLCNQKYVLL